MKIDETEVVLYRKKGVQPMFPWHERVDMEGVSISQADIDNGSPQAAT